MWLPQCSKENEREYSLRGAKSGVSELQSEDVPVSGA
jgi:hypothetical protein